jgi:hypothetical protein
MLFSNLPIQLAPPRDAKEANRRIAPASNPKAVAPRKVYVAPVQAIPLSRIAPRNRHNLTAPLYSTVEFIGPLDLRPFMVRRFKAGNAENINHLQIRKARAIPLGEAARELCGEPEMLRVGLLDIANQMAKGA